MQDIGYTLAENIVDTQYEDLPEEVVDITKKTILDTLGTILGGSGTGDGIENVVEMVKAGGGTEESTVFGHGIKTNVWTAAFANGAMAHAMDYDNVHDDAFTHPSTSTVPAAFAVAEQVGRITGKEFITAMALGDDLHCRLAFSLSRAGDPALLGWLPPLTLGGFAAAAVSSRLMGFDRDRIVDAFGITLNRTGGPLEVVIDPGLLRGLYAAFPAMTGVFSATMARFGIPGIKNCFEGKAGFFNAYFRGVYDRTSLTDNLGKVFEGVGVSFKPWPSCRFTNPYIDATLRLVNEYDVRPDDVEEIIAFYKEDNVKNCCEPLDVRYNPKSAPEAKLSLPFTIALALALRKVEIGGFSPDNISSPALLDLAKKVKPVYNPRLKSDSKTMLPAVVEIKLKDGTIHSKRVDLVYGHPENPMIWEDIIRKFRDCASYSANPIPKDNIDLVADKIKKLENISDIKEILSLIA
jgi:2-methylcitrate dehydratase PrpD